MSRKHKSAKFYILLIILTSVIALNAQVVCDIKIEDWVEMPVCYGEAITLSVESNTGYTYQWKKNGNIIEGENSFLTTQYITENNTVFSVEVTDLSTQESCTSSITITMREPFKIEFEQTQLTCSNNKAENGQNAKAIATASGEGFVSFSYEWGSNSENDVWTNPNNPREAIGLKAWKEYYVTVTGVTSQGESCSQTAYFTPKSYPNPILEIISEPKDTAYIQNPIVQFHFDGDVDMIEHNSWSWAFYDNPDKPNVATSTSILEEPVNVYAHESKEGHPFRIELTVKSAEYGCDTTFESTMIVLPVKLRIPNIFTPNGDGINDYFIIDNDSSGGSSNDSQRGGHNEYDSYKPLNDYYLRTELTIFNRWGRIVYKSSDYRNDWDGGKLPDGTYFYVLECVGEQNNHRYQGSVTIFGSGR